MKKIKIWWPDILTFISLLHFLSFLILSCLLLCCLDLSRLLFCFLLCYLVFSYFIFLSRLMFYFVFLSRLGPYWSLMFEVSENKEHKPVNLDTMVEVRMCQFFSFLFYFALFDIKVFIFFYIITRDLFEAPNIFTSLPSYSFPYCDFSIYLSLPLFTFFYFCPVLQPYHSPLSLFSFSLSVTFLLFCLSYSVSPFLLYFFFSLPLSVLFCLSLSVLSCLSVSIFLSLSLSSLIFRIPSKARSTLRW